MQELQGRFELAEPILLENIQKFSDEYLEGVQFIFADQMISVEAKVDQIWSNQRLSEHKIKESILNDRYIANRVN